MPSAAVADSTLVVAEIDPELGVAKSSRAKSNADGLPSFEDVLLDNACPCRKVDFRNFLVLEHGDENLDFLDNVNTFVRNYDKLCKSKFRDQSGNDSVADITGDESPKRSMSINPAEDDLNSTTGSQEGKKSLFGGMSVRDSTKTKPGVDARTYARLIQQEFLQEGGMRQVNVSSEVRNRFEEELDALPFSDQPRKEIFDEAFDEIRLLLKRDAFPRFMKKLTTQNINDREGYRRYMYAFCIFLPTLAALIALVLTPTHPLIRIALWLPWSTSFGLWQQGYFRFCSTSADNGVRMLETDEDVFKTLKRTRPEDQVIQIEAINRKLRQRTRVFHVRSTIVSVLWTVITLCIPPSAFF